MAWRTVSAAFLAIGFAIGCRAPTQVTVELTTDVPCGASPTTSLQVGRSTVDLEGRPPLVRTTKCNDSGRIGSIVLVPSEGNDDSIALKVVLAHGGRLIEDCWAADKNQSRLASCIVARREVKFTPHTDLSLPIELRRDCDGVVCSARENCSMGTCQPTQGPGASPCSGHSCADGNVPPFDASDAPADVSIDREEDSGDAPYDAAEERTLGDSFGDEIVDAGMEDRSMGDEVVDATEDRSVGDEIVDAGVDGEATARDAPADRDARASGGNVLIDASADELWERWLSFLAQREAQFDSRRIECLNEPINALQEWRWLVHATEGLQGHFQMRLIGLDESAMAECLAVLRNASCSEIAKLRQDETSAVRTFRVAPFTSCKLVLAGLSGEGKGCFDYDDCQPDLECRYTNECGNSCISLPRAKVGELCGELQCEPDAICVRNFGIDRCVRAREGDPCAGGGACAPGLFCRFGTPGGNVCRPIEVGSSCEGSWACPSVLTCAREGDAAQGFCRAGRDPGEPCTEDRDCAFARCVDWEGKGLRCLRRAKLGQPCGFFTPEGGELVVECEEGYCDTAGTSNGLCASQKPEGSPCWTDDGCFVPDVCGGTPLKCLPPGGPGLDFGAPCNPQFGGCRSGSFCRHDPTTEDPSKGFCRPNKVAGESCTDFDDRCEQFTFCVIGVCEKCF